MAEYKMGPYVVSRCPCGQRGCSDWHVSPVAATQGVNFTEKQARAVAAVLTVLDVDEPKTRALALIKWVRDHVEDSDGLDWTNTICDRLDQVTDVLEFRT